MRRLRILQKRAECDFCALTMERVECYETACADFEDME